MNALFSVLLYLDGATALPRPCMTRPFLLVRFSLSSMEEKESAGAAEEVDAIIGELETLQQG